MERPEFIRSLPVGNELGESVLWHPQRETLWWTDLHSRRLYCYDPASDRLNDWQTPERLCSFGFVAGDAEAPQTLIAAFAPGLALYTPQTGDCHWLARPESDRPANRFNDGKVDRRGRFWAGTMAEPPEPGQPAGSLYVCTGEGEVSARLQGFAVPNGLSWSPEGTTAYASDSAHSVYYAYDFEPHSATFSNRRVFARTPEHAGPDGSCVDAAGNVWNAQFGGGKVVCYSPEGEVLLELDVPVSQPTCVAFGGPDMSWLFVTTARENLSQAQLAKEPGAGNLLIYRTGVEGLPADFFRG